MDQSKSTGFKAGQATGQAQEKNNQMMNQVSNAAQSAKDMSLEAGKVVQEKAVAATDAVKNTLGMNK